MKNILAIDLGTHTGLAYNIGPEFRCKTLTLATVKELKAQKLERFDRRNDMRVRRLFSNLSDLHDAYRFGTVVVEDVLFASSTYAVQLWASLRASVWLAFPPANGTVLEFVPVGTLKKFATGHGGATKEMMADALLRAHPDKCNSDMDENGIDATWLWLWGEKTLTRAPKSANIPH